MEKATLFFCDIYGTFSLGATVPIDYNEIQTFVEYLAKLSCYEKSDKLIFTFVTTEGLDTVLAMHKLLSGILPNHIIMGKHIYFDGVKNVNKPCDIIEYIRELEKNYDINKNIYFADDCEFFHLLLKEFNEFLGAKYNIQSIIPAKGLSDVNLILGNLLDNHTLKRILFPIKQ